MLSQFSIRTKISTLVVALLVVMAALGGLALLKMRTINASTVDIATNWMPSMRELGNLRTHLAMFRVVMRAHAMEPTKEDKAS
ncbi:Tar ligand binding domain-containing protein, partial [Rhodopseudomonas sp. B29]|uniref:Tar ligand binding domain-containing protein n=1 Tax=Rhodopseudomonas sp. B29 TaxID=95607 RepID=UPI000593F78A